MAFQFKSVVTARAKVLAVAVLGFVASGGASMAQDRDLTDLFDALRGADADRAPMIEQRIWEEWAKSGSPAMDLLLERGRAALEAENYPQAVDLLSALIDHAPDFAEAYNARATAYFQQGAYGPSLADIRSVLALNPRHFGALSGLAVILEDLGREGEALTISRAIRDIYPAREGLDAAIDRLERKVDGTEI